MYDPRAPRPRPLPNTTMNARICYYCGEMRWSFLFFESSSLNEHKDPPMCIQCNSRIVEEILHE